MKTKWNTRKKDIHKNNELLPLKMKNKSALEVQVYEHLLLYRYQLKNNSNHLTYSNIFGNAIKRTCVLDADIVQQKADSHAYILCWTLTLWNNKEKLKISFYYDLLLWMVFWF